MNEPRRRPVDPAGARPTDPAGPDGGRSEDSIDEAALDRELATTDQTLARQLRELLDPDDGLGSRTADDVSRALRSRSGLSAALDLLGTGWWTARELLTDDQERADGEHEGI